MCFLMICQPITSDGIRLGYCCCICSASFYCFIRPAHWLSFTQRLQLLGANSLALRKSRTLSPEALLQLTSDSCMVLSRECKTNSQKKFQTVMSFEYLSSSASLCHGASHSALWIPLDLVLEDSMDGYQVSATSSIETISGEIENSYQNLTEIVDFVFSNLI